MIITISVTEIIKIGLFLLFLVVLLICQMCGK